MCRQARHEVSALGLSKGDGQPVHSGQCSHGRPTYSDHLPHHAVCRQPADDRRPPLAEADIDDEALGGRVLADNGHLTGVECAFKC